MTAESALAAGRDAALALMDDVCTVVRPNSTGHTTDPATGVVTYAGATIYTGACRVQMLQGTRGDALEQAAERAISVQNAIVSLPITAVGIRVDDVITVTASTLDPDLVNRVYRVVAMTHKTFLTARRLICQEVTA